MFTSGPGVIKVTFSQCVEGLYWVAWPPAEISRVLKFALIFKLIIFKNA